MPKSNLLLKPLSTNLPKSTTFQMMQIWFLAMFHQDAHLISSQYFGVLKQHQCFDPTTTALAAAHGTVQHNHLSCHSKAGRGEAPGKTWDWIHLTQFPSAVEQLSRSLFVVLNGCFRGKFEASKTLDLDLKSFKTDLLRIPSMRLSLPWDSHIDLELHSTKLLKQR